MTPDRCPCCGQLNQCAQHDRDEPVSQCWCFDVQIAPRQLEQLPPELRDRSCLCPRCASALPVDGA
ncbi:cysteine-rich CWC family protein [Phytopseudomonas flavescens]|uniref:cysteine-rich CWC family protein n=1 Tax=Phytopseudomonas flavescens TaxID=29435 RepID=UPI000A029CB9|nr:cysteine-rich CWC family protein [Pseudomonas flavescens]